MKRTAGECLPSRDALTGNDAEVNPWKKRGGSDPDIVDVE
jgi:hypothetical protein